MVQEIKKDTTGKKVQHSHLRLQCGDCLHFKGTAHPSFGKPCNTLGIRAKATAPDCYTANVRVFRSLGPDFVQNVVMTVSSMDPSQTRVFMGLMKQATSLEKLGFTFMQKVYFSVGGDTLADWFSGFVFGTGPDAGTIQVVGRDMARGSQSLCTAVLLATSVVKSQKRWQKIKDGLIARGQIDRLPEKQKAVIKAAEYEPPTLETDPSKLEAAAGKLRKGNRSRLSVDENGNGTLFSIGR